MIASSRLASTFAAPTHIVGAVVGQAYSTIGIGSDTSALLTAASAAIAMAREPAERYASVRALADDVEHWLADEPMSAYAEPVRQRVGRWVRRHKPAVTALAALATVAVVTAASWWLVADARSRADTQQVVATVMTGLRDEADQQRKEAVR